MNPLKAIKAIAPITSTTPTTRIRRTPSISWSTVWLQSLIAARRVRPLSWLGLGLILLATGYLCVGVRWEQHRNEQMSQQIRSWAHHRQGSQYHAADDGPLLQEDRRQQFLGVLGRSELMEQYVKQLFAIAHQHNLSLPEAEYRLGGEQRGGFISYAIALPLKGAYPAIQAFCEDSLLAMPFASLDLIQFRRESAASEGVEVKVHFTLYLRPEGVRTESPQPENAAKPEAALPATASTTLEAVPADLPPMDATGKVLGKVVEKSSAKGGAS